MTEKRILMIGDSLIEYGNWEELLGRPVINRGLGGDTTEGVCLRLPLSLKLQPDQIVMMAGVNDLIGGYTPEHVLQNLKACMEKIRSQCPEAMVFVHKLLPCNHEKGTFFVYDNQLGREVNRVLPTLCAAYQAVCIDLSDVLTADNELIAAYTLDGIHLTEAAYRIWGEKLRKYL